MLHEIMSNPWRVHDSDDEDDVDRRLYRHVSFSPRPMTPNILTRQSTPRLADWDPIIVEERHKKKFGRRKTAPKFENAPSNHKPIFYGTRTLKSSHSMLERTPLPKPMIANTPDTPPATPPIGSSNYDPILFLQENLKCFIYTYIPKDYPSFIHCYLRRDKTGIQKGFFPTYYLQIERPSDGRKILLLAARKVAKVNRQSEYVITTDIETLSAKSGGDGYVGKLRENNVSGTEFTLYDTGVSPNKCRDKQVMNKNYLRRELAGIVYNTSLFGLNGPKQMNVLIPNLDHNIQPTKNEDTILDQWRDRTFSDTLLLKNRLPRHDEQTKIHMLQFQGGRVIRSSSKNFQMVLETAHNQEEVVMQFGRIDDDTFTCDYRYPLSAIQAFGIALSTFNKRLARD